MAFEPARAHVGKKEVSATTIVLVLVCVMYGFTYVDRVNVSTAASVFQKELHLTNAEVGLVFSAFAYPYLLFTIFGGWLSDRFGARRMLTAAAAIWGTATLCTGVVATLPGMLLARLMLGLGEGASFPVAARALCDWTLERKRGFAQGITHSCSRLGTAATPPLVTWLIAVTTWRGSFVVLGSVSLLWALVWAAYFRDDPRNHRGVNSEDLDSLPIYISRAQRKAQVIPWRALVPRMLPVTAVYFCYGWTLWLYLAWIPSYFFHGHGLDLRNSALFSAGVFFAGVLGDTLGGMSSDYILLRTGDRNKARRNLVVFGFICSLAAMIPILFVRQITLVATCLSVAFFFSEFTIGPMWAIPMDIAPEYSGSATGLMNVGSPLAAIISPLIFGYIIDKTGNWNLPFLGSIGLLFCGSILAFWMKPEETLARNRLSGPRVAHTTPELDTQQLP